MRGNLSASRFIFPLAQRNGGVQGEVTGWRLRFYGFVWGGAGGQGESGQGGAMVDISNPLPQRRRGVRKLSPKF